MTQRTAFPGENARGEDGAVRVLDARTGALVRTLKQDENALSVAFSPDGRTLVTGHAGCGVVLWDAETGAVRRTLKAARSARSTGTNIGIRSVAFSPDGTLLACGHDSGEVIVWRIGAGPKQ